MPDLFKAVASRVTGNEGPKVYAVVLNWNRYSLSKRCLDSLRAWNYSNLNVVVVDNGSTDGSAERLALEYPNCEILKNGRNLGFSRGCNVGLRRALRDPECEYTILVNNDATVAPDGLTAAVQFAEANPDVGLVTGKILRGREEPIFWYAGGEIDLWRGQAKTIGFGETDRGQYDSIRDVSFATGALMLIRRPVLEKVGLLPEEYFFGVEEWDYSLMVANAGFRVVYVPKLLAFHPGDGSHWNYDPRFVYNYYRNKLIFQQKYLNPIAFYIWKLAFRLYGKLLARKSRQSEVVKWGVDRAPRQGALDFALEQAILDHGSGPLTEETMLEFERKLQARASKG